MELQETVKEKCYQTLNEQKDGYYESILTPYESVVPMLCIKTQSPLKPESAELLCWAYRRAESWVFPGEESATSSEILRAAEQICTKTPEYNQYKPKSIILIGGGMVSKDYEVEF